MSGAEAEANAALEINDAFYAAFRDADLEAMDALWAKQEPVLCQHPGRSMIHGRIGVMASWHAIFSGGAPPVQPLDARVTLIRGVAFVSCVERIGNERLGATNVFVWEQGGWKLVLHSAGRLAEIPTSLEDVEASGTLH